MKALPTNHYLIRTDGLVAFDAWAECPADIAEKYRNIYKREMLITDYNSGITKRYVKPGIIKRNSSTLIAAVIFAGLIILTFTI